MINPRNTTKEVGSELYATGPTALGSTASNTTNIFDYWRHIYIQEVQAFVVTSPSIPDLIFTLGVQGEEQKFSDNFITIPVDTPVGTVVINEAPNILIFPQNNVTIFGLPNGSDGEAVITFRFSYEPRR